MGWRERQAARERLGLLGNKKKNEDSEFQLNPYTFDPDTIYHFRCVSKESYISKKGYHMWKIHFIFGDDTGIVLYDRPWASVYPFRVGQDYEANITNGKPFLKILNIQETEPDVQPVSNYQHALWGADLEVIVAELNE